MRKYIVIAITLIVLMTLPILASLTPTQTKPSTTPLSISPHPTLTTHPMIPVTPGQPVNIGPKNKVSKNTAAAPCPLPLAQCNASFNWGGYAVTGPTGSVSDVKGAWTVPKVRSSSIGNGQCFHNDVSWYDLAQWIGIDGWSSNTVEQTGTGSDCYYGTLYYYAWSEFFPTEPEITVFPVNPGDKMTAEVTFTGTAFTTTITDLTTHQTSTRTEPLSYVPGAEENSAEWISETAAACLNPSCSIFSFLDLTDFGTGAFSGATATVSGSPGPISSFGSNVQWVEMVNLNFPATPAFPQEDTKDYPTALTASGDGFTVEFVSAGP